MSLASLWLPIVLSAVFVFVASALINMLLKFWHAPDYGRFANEDEIRAAIRNGNPAAPGQYALPWCTPEAMKDPAMQAKLKEGPVGMVYLRRPGSMNMGASLLQWFLFCVLVSLFCALIAAHAVPPGANRHLVFHVTAVDGPRIRLLHRRDLAAFPVEGRIQVHRRWDHLRDHHRPDLRLAVAGCVNAQTWKRGVVRAALPMFRTIKPLRRGAPATHGSASA
jgi:hypothetical protein